MVSDDKFIELITAGINRLTMAKAEVEWNVKIDTRQFDVLATIQNDEHRILIAFEVKHRKRPVAVDMMDAFVTKAKDAHVDRAVFVSTSGYQSGALRVAEAHGIDVFNISFVENPAKIPEHSLIVPKVAGSNIPAPYIEDEGEVVGNSVQRITLTYSDGSRLDVPNEQSQMRYYMQKSTVGYKTLESVIAPFAVRPIEVGEVYVEIIPETSSLTPPDRHFLKPGQLKSIEIEVTAAVGRLLSGNVEIELSSFSHKVCYENVLTGEKEITEINKLPMGVKELTAGGFYFMDFPLRYFYCAEIVGTIATIWMVESFQFGSLHRSIFKIDTRYASKYIPVSKKQILGRLQKRLEEMRLLERRQKPR